MSSQAGEAPAQSGGGLRHEGEWVARVVAAYESGSTSDEAAAVAGVSTAKAYAALRERGVLRTRSEAAKHRYGRGREGSPVIARGSAPMSVRELAEALLALESLPPVQRERECVRLAREAKGTLAAGRAAAVREAEAGGMTNAEFARQVDIAPAQISRLLKENPASERMRA